MARKHWTLEDIPWESFEPGKVDPDLLSIIKAASLVEFNGYDYADYLCNIFPDDPEFKEAAQRWAVEEVQHGQALGRWAEMADPEFDFKAAVDRFNAGYSIPVESNASVRGSRSGELVARCIVETGTSSYYTALGEASEEPVLRAICRHIAADELRHYKLFYDHLKRYLAKERIGRAKRLWVVLGRIGESEDDELAYAYYAANGAARGEAYDRKQVVKAYIKRAYAHYRPHHVQRMVAMGFKAAGLAPQGRLARLISSLAYRFIRRRAERYAAMSV